jgi:hypothetical protein
MDYFMSVRYQIMKNGNPLGNLEPNTLLTDQQIYDIAEILSTAEGNPGTVTVIKSIPEEVEEPA